MSDSTIQTTQQKKPNKPVSGASDAPANGRSNATGQTLTPFTEDDLRRDPAPSQTEEQENGGSSAGTSGAGDSATASRDNTRSTNPANANNEQVVPPDAGKRIPIPINGASSSRTSRRQQSASTQTDAAPAVARPTLEGRKGRKNRTSGKDSRFQQMAGAAQASLGNVMSPQYDEEIDEGVEERVNRLRPKSIMMQLRFLYTLVFSLWLFGRLVIWQVYVAKLFPEWVNNRNTQRWRKYAKEFRQFALRMGGVQIKAGQFASTRADILPEEVIAELAGLQDKVPTIPFKRIKSVLDDEIGDIDERYDWIREEPVAAASLGQVHRAKLKGGERVVVKVQRPDVRNIVYTDLAALFVVARVAMRFEFIRRRTDAELIVDEFGRVLLEEVSYTREMENAKRFQQMFADDNGVYVPHVYDEHSSDKVLTIEDVTSIKIDDFERLAAAGIDRKDVANRLMDTYMQQIFEDRFFHADPHPGNLFIYPLPVEDESQYIGTGGRPFYLVFIDFGMTGSLTREIVRGLVNTLTAVLTRDEKKLVASYEQLGFLMPGADTKRIEEATKTVFDEVWGLQMSDMRSIDFEVVEEIGDQFNDLLYDMPFRVPQDFVYLGRTIGILSGMATALDPEFNPWTEIQRNVQDLILTDEESNIFNELSQTLENSFQEIVADGPQGFVRVVERFLQQFRRVSESEKMLRRLVNGDVRLETRMSAQQRQQLQRIEVQGKRTTRAFIFGSVLITSTLLYTAGDVTLATGGYVISGLLLLSVLFARQ